MLKLLVALDFSDCSRAALEAALTVAERASPVELVLLTVLEPLSDSAAQTHGALSDTERAVDELTRMVDAAARARGHHAGLPATMHVHFTATRGAPAEQIIEQAGAYRVDALVMGTHGRTGLNRLIAGSVAERVVRSASCSVLTVKPKKTA
jgi:nucleotide-binding universal stress UspA family protein